MAPRSCLIIVNRATLAPRSCLIIVNRAYPGSEFVVANTLAKWKKLSQMKMTSAKVLARKYYQEVVLH